MKKIVVFLIITFFINLVSSQTKKSTTYLTSIKICNKFWTTSNLDVSNYSDGTPIPQVTDPTEWANLTTGAWCYYDNNPAYNKTYGKLYNWYAVAGIFDLASAENPTLRKKLAPVGWHVPTENDWSYLINCLGGINSGYKMKEIGKKHWSEPNKGATNTSGFTGLPGGCRFNSGTFNFYSYSGYWWSCSLLDTSNAFYHYLDTYQIASGSLMSYKSYGYSVRCIKD